MRGKEKEKERERESWQGIQFSKENLFIYVFICLLKRLQWNEKRVAFLRSCHPLFYWPVLWMGTFTLAKSQPLDRLSLLEPRNIMSLFSSEDIASMSLYLTNKPTFEIWRLLDETCSQSHARRPLGASVSLRLVAEFEIKWGSWRRSSPTVMQPFVSQRTGRGTPVALREMQAATSSCWYWFTSFDLSPLSWTVYITSSNPLLKRL